MRIHVYDYSFHEVISGGDAIAAEFARAWSAAGHRVVLHTHADAAAFFRSRGVDGESLVADRIAGGRSGVLVASLLRTAGAMVAAFTRPRRRPDVIFAQSYMLPDLLPAIVDKLRNPRARLVAGCFLLPEPPRAKAYGSSVVNRYAFYATFKVGLWLARMFAVMIWSTGALEAKRIRERYRKPAFPIRGGVDAEAAARPGRPATASFDAVYLGRFHPQKSVLDLVDLWPDVLTELPGAKLLLVGDGFQRAELMRRIDRLGMREQVTMMGQIDNDEKFALLSSCRIFVTASRYDSGNIALDEALGCGTPGVIYDLPVLHYPAGVEKVEPFDRGAFVKAIVELLRDDERWAKRSREASEFARTISWDVQASRALASLSR